jgi:hypothetical protein
MVLSTLGGYKTYLTQKQARFPSQAFEAGKLVVRIEDETFSIDSISCILTDSGIEGEDNERVSYVKLCEFFLDIASR